MRRLLHRIGMSIAMVLILLFLPGCWDYQAINTKATLIGIGIDPVPDHPDMFRLTIQYPNMASGGGGARSGAASSSTKDYQNESAEGYSIAEIFKQLQLRVDRNIDAKQLRALVVSEKLPQAMLDNVLGEMVRQQTLNVLAYVAVTPESAEQVLNTRAQGEAPMDIIQRKFSTRFHQHGYFIRRQLWEYWRDKTKIGVTPVLPVLKTSSAPQSESEDLGSGSGSSSDGASGAQSQDDLTGGLGLQGGASGSTNSPDSSQDDLVIEGFTVLGQNNQRWTLDRHGTFLVNVLNGDVQGMAVNFHTERGVLAFSDMQIRHRMGCATQNGQIQLVDKLRVKAHLARLPGHNIDPMSSTELTKIETQFGQYLTKQLTEQLHQFQQKEWDIFGFSQLYLQKHPGEEQEVKNNWGKIFRSAKTDIQVKVEISSKGMLI